MALAARTNPHWSRHVTSSSDYSGNNQTPTGEPPSRSDNVPGDLTDNDVTETHTANLQSDDESSQIYLSVLSSGYSCKVGLAYYDVNTTEMYLMTDIQDTEDFQTLKKVIQQVRPIVVVTSAREDDRVCKAIQQTVEVESPSETNPNMFTVLPSAEFNFEMSKHRITFINLKSFPAHSTDTERLLYVNSLVPFDSVCMVCALGGLLRYLEKNRVGIELEGLRARVPVLGIHLFTLEDLVLIDDHTYRGLQIFERKASKKNVKEGLSIYGLLNRCTSNIGSKLLRQWLLQPLTNLKKLEERQNAVEFFANPRNTVVSSELQQCLRHIKSIARILHRMTRAQATVVNWQTLYKTVYNAIHIADVVRSESVPLAIFKKIDEHFTEELARIINLISRLVDFEESVLQGRFVVKHGVDPELDEKKRTYSGLPDFMTKVAREELLKLSDEITHCNVVYLPQLGYLLTILMTEAMRESDNFEIEGLEFIFHSNGVMHYKSANTRELDRLLGDTRCDITDYETDVMHKLQNVILEHSQVLVHVIECAAELDCLIALGLSAREYNYVKPKLTTANSLHIKNGRHPLQELCCSPFVPNDLVSGGTCSKMKVLTGPNACGKSVYLKQVALIVFMAQIGSFVPADAAEVGLVKSIHTRIRTLESVSVRLSAFMIDLSQVSSAALHSTSSSLVILDEFGKGTDVSDGLAILSGCLKYWLDKGADCPHMLISTHFHSIVRLLPQSPLLTFQTMETLREDGELVYLFHLKEGSAKCSYACSVAAQALIPQEIITRGMEISDLLKKNQPIHRVDTASTETQYKRCETIVEKFLQLDIEKDDVQAFLKDTVVSIYQGKGSCV